MLSWKEKLHDQLDTMKYLSCERKKLAKPTGRSEMGINVSPCASPKAINVQMGPVHFYIISKMGREYNQIR